MRRVYVLIAWCLCLAVAIPAGSALAQSDPFQNESKTAASEPSPACEYVTRAVCDRQDTAIVLKSGGYVIVAVLLFSLLRVWWDRRGTQTAGLRFVATLLSAAGLAGVLVYLDPMRGKDLACCLASSVFTSHILLQDSAIGRAALLGFVPAAALFVVVAVIVKTVRS
jgi:hypothetical protein